MIGINHCLLSCLPPADVSTVQINFWHVSLDSFTSNPSIRSKLITFQMITSIYIIFHRGSTDFVGGPIWFPTLIFLYLATILPFLPHWSSLNTSSPLPPSAYSTGSYPKILCPVWVSFCPSSTLRFRIKTCIGNTKNIPLASWSLSWPDRSEKHHHHSEHHCFSSHFSWLLPFQSPFLELQSLIQSIFKRFLF